MPRQHLPSCLLYDGEHRTRPSLSEGEGGGEDDDDDDMANRKLRGMPIRSSRTVECTTFDGLPTPADGTRRGSHASGAPQTEDRELYGGR